MKSLFFSGEARLGGPLEHFCKTNHIELTARSLLKFEAVPFEITKTFEVIFFSSIRSYNYFISQFNDLINIELACVGEQTAIKINEKSSLLSFVGSGAGDPAKVAQEFKSWLGERRVLFPVSEQSAGTIADAIPEEQKEVVVCYQTLSAPLELKDQDIYVFTSPSNVKAYLDKNVLPAKAIIIAWGKTTERKLVENKIVATAVLGDSTEDELAEVIGKLL